MTINWHKNLAWTIKLSNDEMKDLFLLLQVVKLQPRYKMIKAVRQQLQDRNISDRQWMAYT